MPLLQTFGRVQEIESMLELALHRLVARNLRAIETSAQPFELVIDLGATFVERLGQSRIDPSQLLLQTIQLAFEGGRRLLKRGGRLLAQILCDHAADYVFRARKEILKCKSVSVQCPPRVLFVER